MFEKLTENVYVETGIVACNLGLVTSKRDGVVVLIDSPQRPVEAVKWRQEVEKGGSAKYLVNTEEHGDHVNGDYFSPGILISHEKTRYKINSIPTNEFRCRIRKTDEASAPLVENYKQRVADITFNNNFDIVFEGPT